MRDRLKALVKPIRIAQADSPIPEYRGEPVSADPAFTVRAEPSINRGFAFQALSQNGGDAMGNLDTPKAIIIAALILSLSATIVFMFRYNYAVSEVSVCFNHLTGTPTDCLMR